VLKNTIVELADVHPASILDDRFPRRHRQRFGRARRRSFERLFKYKKEERLNSLIYLDRDGQFLSENGQFVVVNGQKTVAKLTG
jgi:hypothetical protein